MLNIGDYVGQINKECQFLIGNVSQLILSVSINDTTPLSPKNQYKTVKKSVDLQHHNISKSLICKYLAIYHYSSLTSTDFPVQNQANFLKKTIFRDKKDRLNHYVYWVFRSTDFLGSSNICVYLQSSIQYFVICCCPSRQPGQLEFICCKICS